MHNFGVDFGFACILYYISINGFLGNVEFLYNY